MKKTTVGNVELKGFVYKVSKTDTNDANVVTLLTAVTDGFKAQEFKVGFDITWPLKTWVTLKFDLTIHTADDETIEFGMTAIKMSTIEGPDVPSDANIQFPDKRTKAQKAADHARYEREMQRQYYERMSKYHLEMKQNERMRSVAKRSFSLMGLFHAIARA